MASVTALLTLSTLFVTSAFATTSYDGYSKAVANVGTEYYYGNYWAVGTGSVSTDQPSYNVGTISGTLTLYEDGSAVGNDSVTAHDDSNISSFRVSEEIVNDAFFHSIMVGSVNYKDGTYSDYPDVESETIGVEN